jgi:hypothetical protein
MPSSLYVAFWKILGRKALIMDIPQAISDATSLF